MKGKLMIGTVLLLVSSLVLAGCGISEEVYNAVVAERDTAQAQVTTLQSDLSSAKVQIGTLESDLSSAQAEVAALKSDLSTAESRVTTLESDVDAAEAELRRFQSGLTLVWTPLEKELDLTLSLLAFYNETEKAEYGLITEQEAMQFATNWLMNTGVSVNAVGDAELSQLWQDLWLYAGEDEVQTTVSLTSLADLVMDLVADDIETMKAGLQMTLLTLRQ